MCRKYKEEIYTDKSGYTMQTMQSDDYEKQVWKICREACRKLSFFKKIIWGWTNMKVPSAYQSQTAKPFKIRENTAKLYRSFT